MAGQIATILCGSCKVPVEGPEEPKPQDLIACPRCGRSDSFETVVASVSQYSRDFVEQHLVDELQRTASRSKFLQFQGKGVPIRSYAFIADLKL